MKMANKVKIDGRVDSDIASVELSDGGTRWEMLIVSEKEKHGKTAYANRFKVVTYKPHVFYNIEYGDVVRVFGALQTYKSKETGLIMYCIVAQKVVDRADVVNVNTQD